MGEVIMETKRLRLEKVKTDDAAFFFELMTSPDYLHFIGDRGLRKIADAAEYIENKMQKSYTEFGFGFYKMVLKESEIPIGICGLVKRPNLEHVDIGFGLLAKYYGQGYAYEAAEVTMNYARTEYELHPIYAITTKDNFSSQKLLEKIGLKNVGTKKWEDGEELLLYSNE